MPARLDFVYVWRFEDKTAFVVTGDAFELDRRWRRRNEFESELHDKLRSLLEQPKPDADLSFLSSPMYSNQARAVCWQLIRKLRDDGYKVLSCRNRDLNDGGFKPKRPVYVPTAWGRGWYPSVSAAARALGISTALVTRKCQDPSKPEWTYDDNNHQ